MCDGSAGLGHKAVPRPRGERVGVPGHALPPVPALRSEDILGPFSPPQGVTHPSSYRFRGPQRGGSGCRGRRRQLCPAGRTQTVRGPGGAPHRTSTPRHPAHRGRPGLGSARSSGRSHPWSPGSGPLAAAPRTGERRSAGGGDAGGRTCKCLRSTASQSMHSAATRVTWAPPHPASGNAHTVALHSLPRPHRKRPCSCSAPAGTRSRTKPAHSPPDPPDVCPHRAKPSCLWAFVSVPILPAKNSPRCALGALLILRRLPDTSTLSPHLPWTFTHWGLDCSHNIGHILPTATHSSVFVHISDDTEKQRMSLHNDAVGFLSPGPGFTLRVSVTRTSLMLKRFSVRI